MPGTLLTDSTLPTIDFANFGDGTSEEALEIGQKFFAACRDVGFAYLINTGIPQEKVDEMFTWCEKTHWVASYSSRFFKLPLEVKMKAPHPPEGWKHRGYSGIGVEQVSQMVFDPTELAAIRTKSPDFKESFDIGTSSPSPSPSSSGTIPENIWIPDSDLPGFKAYCTEFYNVCKSFEMLKLLPALAIGLEYHSKGENQLRLLHYPEAEAEVFESGKKGRIGAHTDFSTGTLLFQDDCGGLVVESPHQPGVFIPAPPVHGAIVFKIGDFLMRWSNDTLKSTLYRVRAPPRKDGDSGITRERFSIPYFISANKEMIIDCLPGCFGPDRPKKYEPIGAG
ncbi:oxidoreductase [Dendrothele bispora CBS 962.96]|uniref:Oxidoreductase n=1 Tax=Dendrothele bispora (strain CBS 962.96) TaxID=1314807 RepID=A0A4S8L3X9_DENBC|nr:oxidoreductase [Dendrothele bispora CBS 962.96]